jgi:Zn-dependent M28 family amino/carboxypeptidase
MAAMVVDNNRDFWGETPMRRTALLVGASLMLLAAGSAFAQPAAPKAQAGNIKAHVTFLADDLMEGREAGSRGYDIAANYVVSQFSQLGLKPAGEKGGFFQTVPLAAVRGRDAGKFVLTGKGGEVVLAPGVDIITGKPFGPADLNVSAPLVFVGYGIDAPGRDDYKGLDVKGKIVVVMSGAPASLNSEERAHHGNARTKRAIAGQHGAVGLISLQTPTDEKRRPFVNGADGWKGWSMSWTGPDGQVRDTAVGPPQLASVSMAGAEKLFAGAKSTYATVAAAAEAGKLPPTFVLPSSLAATIHTESKMVKSENIAGLLEGSDPALKSEVVVLSAHLDHIGLTTSGEDKVNNGALDNASGIATMLEAARLFVQSGQPPRRSVLFLAVTGEEKGLLGSEYFARNPTLPGVVADVNLDMPILLYNFTDVVALGAERSGVGEAVRRAGARMNVALVPDPLPEEGRFTRSDQYRFVEAGVPAVGLKTGPANGGDEKTKAFLAGCYHHACDDLSQPIDYAAGAKFAELNYYVAREMADAEKRPLWKKGDFFGTRFAKPDAIAP